MEEANVATILTDPVGSAACPKCGSMLDVNGLPAFTTVQCPSCSCEFPVPARFGQFMLLKQLGAGGMGGVYRARDEALNREVAIKVMLKSLGDDPQFVETFQREAQAAARLNHPHIAQIYSFGQEKGQPYIAMELVSGGSLDKMMAEQGPLDPTIVIHVGAQVAEGLREAADAGMVHGDVKPENILFDNEKNAKLVDFGLSAMASGPGNEVWGTPYYIAPEKVRRQKSDFRSDIYSLGGTLYHAIAGVPPFEGEDATAVVKARFDGPPKALHDLRGGVPKDVEDLIGRMLEVEPQTRYPTYGSLLGDMRRYLSKAGPVKMDKGSKKIMIKGKRGGVTGKMNTTGAMMTTGAMAGVTGSVSTTGAVGELPAGMVPVDQAEEVPESEEAASKRGVKILLMVLGGVLAAILALVGIVMGVMHHSKTSKAKAETAQIEKGQASARASIAKAVGNAKITVDKIAAFVPEALGYAKESADEVVKALGEDVRSAMVPPEPDYAQLQQAAAAAASAVSAAAGAATNAAGAAAASNAAPAAAANAEPAADAAPAAGDLPPVVAIVRSMYEDAYSVKAASLYAESVYAEITETAKRAESMTGVDKATAEALIKLNNELVEKVNNLGYDRQISEVPRKTSRLKRSLDGVKTDLAALIERRRQDQVEKDKRAKADAVAEKKRQELEALKAKEQEEIGNVNTAMLNTVPQLKQLEFREAARALKELRDGLETKGGLDALDVAEDRVKRIKEFHEYLVQNVPGFKSARGWSVESADKKTMSVAGHKIPWIEVYEKRMDIVGELVNGLVIDPQATKNLRLREKTRLMTNAALSLSLFYRDIASAQERAKALATDAARDFEMDADTIKKLLPEFFE